MTSRIVVLALALAVSAFTFGCKDDEPALPDASNLTEKARQAETEAEKKVEEIAEDAE